MTPHDDPPAAVGLSDDRIDEILTGVDAEYGERRIPVSAYVRAGYAAAQSAPQVPREPTQAMIDAADSAWHKLPVNTHFQRAWDSLWKAMYDAAPPAASAQGVGREPTKFCVFEDCDQTPIDGRIYCEGHAKQEGRNPETVPLTPVPAPAAAVAEPPTSVLYTTRQYPCGCRAEGSGDVPAYCAEHGTPEPAPAATGDELVQNVRVVAKLMRDRHLPAAAITVEQAADRIEADARRIAELEQEVRDTRHAAHIIQDSCETVGIRMRAAEAARDAAVALLRDIYMVMMSDGDATEFMQRIDAFLAQADAGRDSKGAG